MANPFPVLDVLETVVKGVCSPASSWQGGVRFGGDSNISGAGRAAMLNVLSRRRAVIRAYAATSHGSAR
ncbi:hypothetical protein D3C81_1067150 [compost metagenome]